MRYVTPFDVRGGARQCRFCLTFSNLLKYAQLLWNIPVETWQEKNKKTQHKRDREKEWEKTCLSGGALHSGCISESLSSSVGYCYGYICPHFFLKPLINSFSCWLRLIHYAVSLSCCALSKLLSSGSKTIFYFIQNALGSQFGCKSPEISHLNSEIQTIALNFTLKDLAWTYDRYLRLEIKNI